MSAAIEFNVADQVREIVGKVFSTLLAAPAVLMMDNDPLPEERISGTIGIAGKNVTGAVYLHLPVSFACQAACAMPEAAAGRHAGGHETNGAVGELCHQIAGALKSALCDADHWCAVSTPSVIRGAFEVEVPPDLPVEKFYFLCLGQRLALEVHLKFY